MSAAVSAFLGLLVFGANWFASAIPIGRPHAWLEDALFYSANTTAAAFWFVFLPSFFIKVRLSPAALDWERRLRLADEIFRREKDLGRGSWWM